MARRNRKKNQSRRNILLVGLGISVIIGIGIFTVEPAPQAVNHIFRQDSEHLVFSPTPQELIGDFGESLSTLCKYRGILYYVTDQGERIQGDITFQRQFTPPFEAGSIVSPFTGKTIQTFEIDVHLACFQREGHDSDVQIIGGQFRNIVSATDVDGREISVSETFNTVSGVSRANPIPIPDSAEFPGTLLTTIKVPAIDIERDLDDETFSYESTIRFIQSYDTTLLIDGTVEKFSGAIENQYKVDIVNNRGSAEPKEPSNKSLKLTIFDPADKVLESGNVWSFQIEMPGWDESEGFPSIVIQDFTGTVIFTKDIPISGSNRDVSIFADRFQFPGERAGEYTISASVPAFREVDTQYLRVVAEGTKVNNPPPPQVMGGVIECLEGFTASNNKCVQNGFPTFVDPTELGQILGVAINTIVPIAVALLIIGIIIAIIASLLRRRGGSGGGRTVIRLVGRGGSSGNGSGNGNGNGQVLPRGFGKQRSAV